MKTRENGMENQSLRGKYSRQEEKSPISPSLIRVHPCNPWLKTLKNCQSIPSVVTLGRVSVLVFYRLGSLGLPTPGIILRPMAGRERRV